MKLSHSSTTKYQECPKSYEFHYKQKLRPKTTNAALPFGIAIDKAIGEMLQGKIDEKDIFLKHWSFGEINKVVEYLPESINLVYSNSDFDLDLLSEDDLKKLSEKSWDYQNEIDNLVDKKKRLGFKSLTDSEKSTLNLANWLTMKQKGLLMLEAFRKQFLPLVKTVHCTQQEISLNNSTITGFVDFVCELKNIGNVVLDLKTSALPYEEQSVVSSPQLALYINALSEKYNTRKAGYVVLIKRINKNRVKTCSHCKYVADSSHKTCNNIISGKRCGGSWKEQIKPEARVQLLVNEIPKQTEKIVIDNFVDICKSIENEAFHRNLQSCVKPWGLCPYYNLCFHNDSSDLVKMEDTNESTQKS